jgi:putative ABC transport system permease protein
MRVIFDIAVRNLVQAWRRTALLSAAIGMVTLILVMLQAMAAGIEDSLVDAATTVSAGHVNVAGFWKPKPSTAAPFLVDKDEIRTIVEENTPGLDYVVERHRGWVKMVSDTGSMYSSLSGLDASKEARFMDTVRLAKESDYVEGGSDAVLGDPRDLANPHTVMLFAAHAKRLGVGVGDAITMQAESPGGQTNTLDVTVVAVAEDMGFMTAFTVFVPSRDVCELYDISENTTGAVWVYLDDIEEAPAVMRHLRDVLIAADYEVMEHQPLPYFMKFDQAAGEDWTGQRLDLTTWDDEVSFVKWVLTAFSAITWFLILVLLAIVAVGIMNTMWNSVRERTGEIGTMRAVGMKRRQVLAMIVTEAFLLGLFATMGGALLGAGLAMGIDALAIPIDVDAVKAILLSDRFRLSVRPGSLGVAVGLLTLCTVISALWPALRAAALRPITAIQHVE